MNAAPAIPKVLLVEDQALIAVYVEELLRQAGFETVETASSCAEAMRWLETDRPDLAIIETRLRDGPCDAIAAVLEQGDIPYLVHTGESSGAIHHPQMSSHRAWLAKPCDPEEFIAAVRRCAPERIGRQQSLPE